VRVPAAFCGLWGIRPTHDAVSAEGVLPFAPLFDTVGWFARTGEMLAKIGDVLLGGTTPVEVPTAFTLCAEAFAARAANEPDDAAQLRALALAAVTATGVAEPGDTNVFDGEQAAWLYCYQQLQDDAIRTSLKAWIEATSPRFGDDIASRFARLDALDDTEVERCRKSRVEIARHINALVAGTVIVLPTTPLALVEKDAPSERIASFYRDALTMDSIAALAGLPQVTVPLSDERDRPLALSLIGPRGSDRALIALARRLFPSVE
jgi:amidase